MTETSNLDRIKDLLNVWAHYYKPLPDRGFPRTCSFVVERVQTSRSTETMVDTIPDDIKRLNDYIEDTLHPDFKRLISVEYFEKGTVEKKSKLIGLNRQSYNQLRSYVYKQLAWMFYGA